MTQTQGGLRLKTTIFGKNNRWQTLHFNEFPLVKIPTTACVHLRPARKSLQTYFAGSVFPFLSKKRGSPPPIQLEGEEIGREIIRSTLMGEFEPIFLALLAQWIRARTRPPRRSASQPMFYRSYE